MEHICPIRTNWIWGVNGHNRTYPAYPQEELETQIRLAAELGATCYRFNFTPKTPDEFDYLDRVVDLCATHGMQVFLVTFDWDLAHYPNPAELEEYSRQIAAHFQGRIAVYQISNEQDIPALDLDRYKDPIGDLPEQYDDSKYQNILTCMRHLIAGVTKGDPHAKTSINISWRHTGLLTMLARDGLSWDITGLDWYYDLADHGGNNLVQTLEILCALPAPAVIIAEANSWEGDYRFTEAEQASYFTAAMNFYYHYHNEKLMGFIIYELLDEPDKESGEGHFGLVVNDPKGRVGRKKLAYEAARSIMTAK